MHCKYHLETYEFRSLFFKTDPFNVGMMDCVMLMHALVCLPSVVDHSFGTCVNISLYRLFVVLSICFLLIHYQIYSMIEKSFDPM